MVDFILWVGFGIIIGFVLGFYTASRLDVTLKISRKEDYEEKLLALESMLEEINEEKQEVPNHELFPPTLGQDYGVPRRLE